MNVHRILGEGLYEVNKLVLGLWPNSINGMVLFGNSWQITWQRENCCLTASVTACVFLGYFTVIVRATVSAAFQTLSPACRAETLQMPASTPVSMVPLRVQIVGLVDVKRTGKPEVLVTTKFTVAGRVSVLGVEGAKLMLCVLSAGATMVMALLSGGAGFQVASPVWDAWIWHVPRFNPVRVVPLMLHSVGLLDVKRTAKPEVALAERLSVVPRTSVAAGAKLMLWVLKGGAAKILSDLLTASAAFHMLSPG